MRIGGKLRHDAIYCPLVRRKLLWQWRAVFACQLQSLVSFIAKRCLERLHVREPLEHPHFVSRARQAQGGCQTHRPGACHRDALLH